LVGYEHIFTIIRPFQDKQIRDDVMAIYGEEKENIDNSRSKKDMSRKDLGVPSGHESTFESKKR
jgi:hypothetical protein